MDKVKTPIWAEDTDGEIYLVVKRSEVCIIDDGEEFEDLILTPIGTTLSPRIDQNPEGDMKQRSYISISNILSRWIPDVFSFDGKSLTTSSHGLGDTVEINLAGEDRNHFIDSVLIGSIKECLYKFYGMYSYESQEIVYGSSGAVSLRVASYPIDSYTPSGPVEVNSLNYSVTTFTSGELECLINYISGDGVQAPSE